MKKRQLFILTLLCLSICSNLTYSKLLTRKAYKNNVVFKKAKSDTIIIKGKVTENKIPFPKANVKLKETEIQTLTDLDGSFTLKIPSNIEKTKIILVVSYVGMVTKEVRIKRLNRNINIEIKPEHIYN